MWSLPSNELTISCGKWSHTIINGAHGSLAGWGWVWPLCVKVPLPPRVLVWNTGVELKRPHQRLEC